MANLAEKGNGYPPVYDLGWDERQRSPAFVRHEEGHQGGGAESCVWCLEESLEGEEGPSPEGKDGRRVVVGEGPQEDGGSIRTVAQIEPGVNDWLLGDWDLHVDPRKMVDVPPPKMPPPLEKKGRKAVVVLPNWLMKKKELASPQMEGVVKRETEKAVLFEGTALIRPAKNCHRCGLEITHPVSQLVGYGPVCSEYLGIPRDVTEEELVGFVEKARVKTKWEGWLPKAQTEIYYE